MNFQIDTIKKNIERCLKVINMYKWLLDLYVLDFFVDNHWEKIPELWCETLQNVDPKDLGDIILGKQRKHLLPLSLLALIETVNALSIPRKSSYIKFTKTCTQIHGCDHPKLKNLFVKHVKLKKRHEINMMSEFVNFHAEQSKCNAVLDFGSGLGHLVRILSYKYKLQSAGIEMQTKLTQEARELDLELEYTAKKYLTESITKFRPTHYNIELSSLNQLQELLLPNNMTNYGLVGLHPCGDLGPLLIRHFVQCDNVKFICIVGCCYMKLSSNKESCGYPMSVYVKSLNNDLSYTSREIACHAIETYCQRLSKGDYKDLKVHAFRAALEKFLVQMDPNLKHMPVRSVKHTNNMTFDSYCEAALYRISVKPKPTTSVEGELMQWKRVVLLYTLRLMVAPLVETVILLDRMLYILEHGISCSIYPLFDPTISPRNHVILGRKT